MLASWEAMHHKQWHGVQLASSPAVVVKSGASFSNTFFLGLSCASGSPAKPSKVTRSPMAAPSGGLMGSTWSCVALDAHSTCPPMHAHGRQRSM